MTTAVDTTPPEEKPAEKKGLRIPGFAQLQRLGKSLMLPIALLPAAGILLRLGQEDLLGQYDWPVLGPFFDAMSAAGGAIFANLPLLFAVGVAIGFARKADGSTALSAVAGYLVISEVFKVMSPVVLEGETTPTGDQAMINYSVFAGIIIGLVTAYLFDRYHTIQLPTYLGFFGGRRFVPIVVSFASLIIGFALSYFYPIFNIGLTGVAEFIGGAGAFGAFVYGFVNRMLIPLGLHHIVNTYIWFLYGDYTVGEEVFTGELTRFAQGDPEAGRLTSGFYPILMFGLPAAALAMIHSARKDQKKVAIGILSAAGLTAFLTGITEPLEFAFMFVAFPLYVLHAVLTGFSLAIAYLLDIHLGFSFSAGLIDLLLYGTAPAAKNIPLLIVMGLVFFVLYYVIFRFAITRWNLMTPGRDPQGATDDDLEAAAADRTPERAATAPTSSSPPSAAPTTSRTSTPASPDCGSRWPTSPWSTTAPSRLSARPVSSRSATTSRRSSAPRPTASRRRSAPPSRAERFRRPRHPRHPPRPRLRHPRLPPRHPERGSPCSPRSPAPWSPWPTCPTPPSPRAWSARAWPSTPLARSSTPSPRSPAPSSSCGRTPTPSSRPRVSGCSCTSAWTPCS